MGSVVECVAMRILNRCIPFALAAGFVSAQPIRAQETAKPTTHTVVAGDNLWDLSKKYLGNPFLWPEIYRLNRDVVEDPHWIYPGEILRLPGEATATPPTVSQLPQGQVPTPQPTTAPTAPQQTTAPATQTVFTKRAPTQTAAISNMTGGATSGALEEILTPTVRVGEVLTAPYVDREGGPRAFGSIIKSGDLPGIAEVTDRSRFQLFDRVLIQPPVGQVAPEGERYLAYKLGPFLEKQGQVIIPTGIVEVTRAARTNEAAVAKVVKAFNELTLSDRLIPIDTAGAGTTTRPTRVANGPSTKITWIYGEPVLSSVQNFIVLNVSSRNGVQMGDEFLIYEPRKDNEGQIDSPDIPIGKAQVVRSTPYGVTAVIVGQGQPLIREGMTARVTAKMP
jgi:nucleoid-associated protein YgaU